MKKKYKVWLVVIIVIIVLIIGLGLYQYFRPVTKKEQIKVNVLDTIGEFGYTIDDRDTELYKNEFNELKQILENEEIDRQAYSEKVARMFIIDLFTINSKINKYDVGGSYFYHSNKREMYENKVKDSLYDLVENDSYGDRKQELPIVKEIETVSVLESTYKLDDSEVSSFIVNLKWSYEKDLGYDKEGQVIVVTDGIKQSVVYYNVSQ